MISVVVPCYNCEKTLSITVDHLLDQSNRDFQIVLVDDGATDSTPQLCDKYAEQDKRIKVIHQNNTGLMRAWKNGVLASDGDYIAFCDADDYLEADFIERMYGVIGNGPVDLILYGMVLDYERGNSIYRNNRIAPGHYDKNRLIKDVYPTLFSDGTMESWAVNRSRCSKVFKKSLLESVMPVLSDSIALGEDDLTTFATVLKAERIICLDGYYPYHYVRMADSMIGRYDERWYEKLIALKQEFNAIADQYEYYYTNQIEEDFFSTLMLYIKKEICNNPAHYNIKKRNVSTIFNSSEFNYCKSVVDYSKYSFVSRCFAFLAVKRRFAILYFATGVMNKLKGRSL